VKVRSGASWLMGITLGITLLALVGGLIIYSYADWPGARYFGIADKKFWDYLELLIVPAALAFGVYWLNRTQDIRQQDADVVQQQRQADFNEMQQHRALETVTQQAQDAALRAYLDQMSQLLIDKERPMHDAQPGDSLSTVARARTLTVLPTLNTNRKRSVLQFLYEAGLIDKEHPIVDLTGAELRGIGLDGANLSGADLSDAYLGGADLSGAILSWTDLSGADLSDANGWTEGQLRAVHSLEGATMPDGQTLKSAANPDGPTFEDWLKDRERRGEDG
jgi:hypothetical protein